MVEKNKIDDKGIIFPVLSLKIILYIFIVLLAIAFVTLLVLCFTNDNSIEVTSLIDGRKYLVRDEFNTEYDKIANNINQNNKKSMKQ
jgi:flagellar basal body-associated protein FliL